MRLQELGVKEVMLIAQDSTDYGYDLGLKDGLAHLLDAIVAAAPAIPWLRIMYAYPGYVTPRLMETMARTSAESCPTSISRCSMAIGIP